MLKYKTAALVTIFSAASTLGAIADTPREIRKERQEERAAERADQAEKIREIASEVTGQRGDQARQLEGRLADCGVLRNQHQIELCKFAAEHSKNEKVKAFAQEMMKDHQQLQERLLKFSVHDSMGKKHVHVADRAVEGGIPPIKTDKVEVRVGYAGDQPSVNDQLYQIERECLDNCLKNVKEKLAQKQGKEFDECFVEMQLAGHEMALANLNAVEKHVTGDFQALIRDAIKTTKAHEAHARSLDKELD
ncbi:DUF4142 domain-containing protein [Planctomicrobium sp. SH668]|uniref:DUF4142 domain-containing protein n=1 Tax=Planctomicrobium sp. SH668 TaxID=3448126 RepID=UPI003F5C52C4